MSVYYVDQPSRRLKIRIPVRLEIAREDSSYIFPHITGHFTDVMLLIPSGCVATSPALSGIYKCHAPEISEAIEQLLKTFIRKLISLGCLSQRMKPAVHAGAGSVLPFAGTIQLVPTVLFPVPFPLTPYRAAVRYMPSLVRLVDIISCNVQWLCSALSPLRNVDPFMARLMDIAQEVYLTGKRRIKEDIRAYVLRADYLLHLALLPQNDQSPSCGTRVEHCRTCHYDVCLCELRNVVGGVIGYNSELSKAFELLPGVSMKMVELNTVSCALAHLSELVARAHNDCVEGMIRQHLSIGKMDHVSLLASFRKLHMQNTPLGGIVDTLATAHEHYVKRYCSLINDAPPCIMQVVTEDLANFFDVYAVADALFDSYGIMVKIVTMKELCQWRREGRLFLRPSKETPARHLEQKKHVHTKYESQPGRLYYMSSPLNCSGHSEMIINEVSVIYYRSCYSEESMDCDRDSWAVRLLCEYSDAVKVPSIPAQLAGAKRIQLLLNDPSTITAILNSDTIVHEHSPSGAHILGMNETLDVFKSINVTQVDPSLQSNDSVVQDALKYPARYVMKSQAEGGAELLVHEDLTAKLVEALTSDRSKLAKYVLMSRINPPVQRAVFVKTSEGCSSSLSVERTVTELGIYGCAAFSGKRVLVEECSSYLARTKNETTAGGGVCSGCSSLSSLLFF